MPPLKDDAITYPSGNEEEAAEGAADEAAGDSEAGEGGEGNIEQLTMILMTVDAEIKSLYNQVNIHLFIISIFYSIKRWYSP